jgi:hypothetical protein
MEGENPERAPPLAGEGIPPMAVWNDWNRSEDREAAEGVIAKV